MILKRDEASRQSPACPTLFSEACRERVRRPDWGDRLDDELPRDLRRAFTIGASMALVTSALASALEVEMSGRGMEADSAGWTAAATLFASGWLAVAGKGPDEVAKGVLLPEPRKLPARGRSANANSLPSIRRLSALSSKN